MQYQLPLQQGMLTAERRTRREDLTYEQLQQLYAQERAYQHLVDNLARQIAQFREQVGLPAKN